MHMINIYCRKLEIHYQLEAQSAMDLITGVRSHHLQYHLGHPAIFPRQVRQRVLRSM